MKAGFSNQRHMTISAIIALRWKQLVTGFALALAVTATPVTADAPPFTGKNIELIGRGQKLDAFLKDLYGQAGLKVRVSSAVVGNIQGKFTGQPEEIWRQLSRAFNLVAYYDGAIVSIYAANEIQTRTFSSESPAQVVGEAKKLRLIDDNNSIKAGSSNVIASGVPAFIQRVEAIAANRIAVKPVAEPVSPVTSVAAVSTSTTDVISPIAGRPGNLPPSVLAGQGSMIKSTVSSKATARTPYEIRIFYLRYANPQDLAPVIRGIMGDGRSSETVASGGNKILQRRAMQQGVRPAGARSNRSDDFDDYYDDRGFGRDDRDGRDDDSNRGGVNGPRIEVDAPNKAIVIRDTPQSMAQYESLIASLDIELPSVELEATIIELNISRAKELGLDFGFSTGGINAVFGGTLAPTTSAPSGSFSGSYLTGAGSLFTARLTALERSGTARVVSKPRFITMNNLEGIFTDEREVYVPLTGERTTDLQVVTAGLVLRVKPAIIYDGGELRTRLEIYIQDGSVVRDENGAPTVQRSQLSTNAVVKQGEAIIVGGLTVSSQFDDKSKTPILGDIPVVGNAFKKRNKRSSRIERLFLITPRVLSQGDDQLASEETELVPIEALEGKKVTAVSRGGTSR
jgi:type III secretion protein C